MRLVAFLRLRRLSEHLAAVIQVNLFFTISLYDPVGIFFKCLSLGFDKKFSVFREDLLTVMQFTLLPAVVFQLPGR